MYTIHAQDNIKKYPFWKTVDDKTPCLHKSCSQCNGTGQKKDGSPCLHMISCPCPRCSPRF